MEFVNRLQKMALEHSSKRGIQMLGAGLAAIGTPPQKKLAKALQILNDYEIQTRKDGVYYREPLKSLIEELYTQKALIPPALMLGQTAAAEMLLNIIRLKLTTAKRFNDLEERENTAIRDLEHLLMEEVIAQQTKP